MENQTDPEFLRREAYNDAEALNTRNEIQRQFRSHPQNWFRWLFNHLDLPPEAHLLELGSGPGDLWLKNLDRLPVGWRLTLSDLSLGMLESARRQAPQPGLYDCTVLDAQAIPFSESQFDAVIGIGLLDHLPDRAQALDEVRRVLKPGGRFYATAGGKGHLQEFATLVHPFLPDVDYGGDAEVFGLENGTRLLSSWFNGIRLFEYSDELVFEQPGPIINYLVSEATIRSEMDPGTLEALSGFVEHELAVRRELRVTVEKGLFIGYQEPGKP